MRPDETQARIAAQQLVYEQSLAALDYRSCADAAWTIAALMRSMGQDAAVYTAAAQQARQWAEDSESVGTRLGVGDDNRDSGAPADHRPGGMPPGSVPHPDQVSPAAATTASVTGGGGDAGNVDGNDAPSVAGDLVGPTHRCAICEGPIEFGGEGWQHLDAPHRATAKVYPSGSVARLTADDFWPRDSFPGTCMSWRSSHGYCVHEQGHHDDCVFLTFENAIWQEAIRDAEKADRRRAEGRESEGSHTPVPPQVADALRDHGMRGTLR